MSGAKDSGLWLVRRDEDGQLVAAELPADTGAFAAVPEKDTAWKPFTATSKKKEA